MQKIADKVFDAFLKTVNVLVNKIKQDELLQKIMRPYTMLISKEREEAFLNLVAGLVIVPKEYREDMRRELGSDYEFLRLWATVVEAFIDVDAIKVKPFKTK